MMSSLLRLPNEILETIVAFTLPDDFERLATASKKLYSLCLPFIPRHNARRAQFTRFEYGKEPRSLFDLEIRTAWDLIRAIAADPLIPYYIVDADFGNDTTFPRSDAHGLFVDIYSSPDVVTLIETSPYLKEAGIKPFWLVDMIASEINLTKRRNLFNRYSQAAATFVLSLLPNARSLTLPDYWSPSETLSGDKKCLQQLEDFVKAVVGSTNRPSARDGLALARLSKLSSSYDGTGERTHGRDCSDHRPWSQKVAPFFALPNLRSLHSRDCVEYSIRRQDFVHAGKLESLHLEDSYFQDGSIPKLIDLVPNLKVFKYSQSNRRCQMRAKWSICSLIDAIGTKLGNHLEELSISALYHTGDFFFEDIHTGRFRQLQKLEFGIELVHIIRDARRCHEDEGSTRKMERDNTDSLLCLQRSLYSVVVPPTVVELSIFVREVYPGVCSSAEDGDAAAGAVAELFRDFAQDKSSVAPVLKRLHLDCAMDVGEKYKEQCEKTVAEVRQAGVDVHVRTPSRYILNDKNFKYDWPDWYCSWKTFYEAHPRDEVW